MKVLNLYAGIGGNRKLWGGVEVTAVELNPKIAEIYKDFFPQDEVIVSDAHQYLLDHFEEFDFIWSSPPCPTHSVCNNFLHSQGVVRYPDMTLYQEIIFLKYRFKGKFCVENVISYYEPLIKPIEMDRHYFWTNFYIKPVKPERNFNIANAKGTSRQTDKVHGKNLEKFHGIKLPSNTRNGRLMLRNCVYPPLGLHILNYAMKKEDDLFSVKKFNTQGDSPQAMDKSQPSAIHRDLVHANRLGCSGVENA